MSLPTWQRLTQQRIIRLDQAIDCYLHRQARRENPSGEFDNAKRWYPCPDTEKQACCSAIRSPSREWPYSLNRHCRSMNHIARLFDVDLRFLKRRAKELETEFWQGLRARLIAEARERHPRQPGTGGNDRIVRTGDRPHLDRPGGNRAKPPAKLPFQREISQEEAKDLDKLLKEIEGLIKE